MSEPFIRLTNVGKIYQTKTGPTEACLDINLEIRQSEFVAIVGPSGCGRPPSEMCGSRPILGESASAASGRRRKST